MPPSWPEPGVWFGKQKNLQVAFRKPFALENKKQEDHTIQETALTRQKKQRNQLEPEEIFIMLSIAKASLAGRLATQVSRSCRSLATLTVRVADWFEEFTFLEKRQPPQRV